MTTNTNAAIAISLCLLNAVAGEGPMNSGIIRANLDPTVRAQDDLFRHVNGKWLDSALIPSDRPATGAFFELRDLSEARVRAIIEEVSKAKGNEEQAKTKGTTTRRRSPTCLRRSWMRRGLKNWG